MEGRELGVSPLGFRCLTLCSPRARGILPVWGRNRRGQQDGHRWESRGSPGFDSETFQLESDLARSTSLYPHLAAPAGAVDVSLGHNHSCFATDLLAPTAVPQNASSAPTFQNIHLIHGPFFSKPSSSFPCVDLRIIQLTHELAGKEAWRDLALLALTTIACCAMTLGELLNLHAVASASENVDTDSTRLKELLKNLRSGTRKPPGTHVALREHRKVLGATITQPPAMLSRYLQHQSAKCAPQGLCTDHPNAGLAPSCFNSSVPCRHSLTPLSKGPLPLKILSSAISLHSICHIWDRSPPDCI